MYKAITGCWLIFLAVVSCPQHAYAQLEVGGGAGLGTGIAMPGANLRVYYSLKDSLLGPGRLRFGPAFTVFLPKSVEANFHDLTRSTTRTLWMEGDFDVHYVCGCGNKLKGYSILGLNVAIASKRVTGTNISGNSYSTFSEDVRVGFGAGMGGMYQGKSFSLFAECKYTSAFDHVVLMGGVLFRIGN